MRLPVSIHTYYIVCRGYIVWENSGSDIHETRQLAIVADEKEARDVCKKSGLRYIKYRTALRMSQERAEKKERVVTYYSQTVAVWDNRKYKGGFPIWDIPMKRGLCATGIFLMRLNKAGKVVRTESSKYGQRHQNEPKRRKKPKMIRASKTGFLCGRETHRVLKSLVWAT